MLRRTFALGAVTLFMALTAPLVGNAQVVESNFPSTYGDHKLVVPPTAALIEKGPKFAVELPAEVIGMVRGGQRNTKGFNTLEFTAKGTMAEPGADGAWHTYQVSKIIAQSDFIIPASRVELNLMDANGQAKHEIRVVSGQKAWNEEKPGINGTPMPATVVADRLREIWLTPQGAMWGALRAQDANDKVMINNEGGHLVISYPWNGENVKITFDAGQRPEEVEIKTNSHAYGNATLVATYSGYKDFQGYLAPFPTKITYKAGSRVILDLNVTDAQANPYVLFTMPRNMHEQSASATN
jgi:hypothetical protein